MNTNGCRFRSLLTAATAIAASCVAAPVLGDAPQAVTITTQVVFNPNTQGTFQASGPICSTGTVHFVDEVVASGPAAFNVNALLEFVCDDNSGTFALRLHPQANARPKDGFELDGPWSVWGKGTGAYESLSGHGDFGVVFDWNTDPPGRTGNLRRFRYAEVVRPTRASRWCGPRARTGDGTAPQEPIRLDGHCRIRRATPRAANEQPRPADRATPPLLA